MANPSPGKPLRFSTRISSHATCFEVRPQTTSVWCVAASVEMLLDFYRYQYSQPRLAAELGLGTHANPTDLPNGMEGKVVSLIEAMTSNALDVTMQDLTMHNETVWTNFRKEIVANRPIISFIYGHARTVAGYLDPGEATSLFGAPGRYLLVYDPAMGGGHHWENVDTMVYTFAFMARLHLA